MLTIPTILTIDPAGSGPNQPPPLPQPPLGTGTVVDGPDRIWELTRAILLDGLVQTGDPSTKGQIQLQTALGTLTIALEATLQQGLGVTAQITPGQPPGVTLFAAAHPVLPTRLDAPTAAQSPGPAVVVDTGHAAPVSLGAGALVVLRPLAAILPDTTQVAAETAEKTANAAAATVEAIAVTETDAGSGLNLIGAVVAAPTQPGPTPGTTTPNPALNSAGAANPILAAMEDAAKPIIAALEDATTLQTSAKGFEPPPATPIVTPGVSAAYALSPLTAVSDAAQPIALQVIAILPPGTAPGQAAQDALVGTVSGATVQNHPIVRTPDGMFLLEPASFVPAGTTILFARRPQGAVTAPLAPSRFDPVAGKDWPSLSEALPALAASNPEIAGAIRLAIPQPGPLLAPILLLFVASLQGGSVRGWLGQKSLDALSRSGRGDLATTLSSDFSQAARQTEAVQSDGWHSVPIPFLVDGAMDRLQLHVRRYPEDGKRDQGEGGGKPDGGVRFLVNVEPSALGPIQLDGLVRRRSASATAPAFDLVLRSRTALPDDIRRDVARVFSESLATSGLQGGLVFQGGAHWVEVSPERRPAGILFA